MKYYQNKRTGELIGVTGGWRDLVSGDKTTVITEVVFPYRWLGQGIISHCMSFSDISKEYKRINKQRAKELCNDFGQWRHTANERNWAVLSNGQSYLEELAKTRNFGFGRAFSDKDKTIQKEYAKTLPNGLGEEYLKLAERSSEKYDSNNIYWAQGDKLMKLLGLI
jgi:hypothetical protein